MLFRIDTLADQPLFEQLVFQVKAAVARGELSEGARLPSVRELARQVQVNPNTVFKAYDALERDGVIVRRQGAGCFVTGRVSELRDSSRQERLRALLRDAATEAFHLGFRPAEIRDLLDQELAQLHFPRRRTRP